jgi:hypothetical protein
MPLDPVGDTEAFPVEKYVNRLGIPALIIPFVGVSTGFAQVYEHPVHIRVARIDAFWRLHARWCARKRRGFPWKRMKSLTEHGTRIAGIWQEEWHRELRSQAGL